VFAKLSSLFFGKPPSPITHGEVAQMIDEAVLRVQKTFAVPLPPPEIKVHSQQLRELMVQLQQMGQEITQLKHENTRLRDELRNNPLPNQLQTLSQSVDELVRRPQPDPQLPERINQLQVSFEQQLRTSRSIVSKEIAQLRDEVPAQQQISALIEQFASFQAEAYKWQRIFEQQLTQLKQAPVAAPAPASTPTPAPNLGRFEEYLSAGRMLLLSGETNQALQSLDLALQANNQSAEVWYYKAMALAQDNQEQPALDCLAQAIQLNPDKAALASSGLDFPDLVSHPRFKQLTGLDIAPEETINLPQMDLASLFE